MQSDTAIVGMSCRLPGAADPERFWELLLRGDDMVREVPEERWSIDRFYSGTYDAPGKAVTRWGTFIDDVDRFDARFFGVEPVEAERVDPQQRILLELVWHALEDAGLDPKALEGTSCGVVVGVSHNDYERIVYKELDGVCTYDGTGCYHSLAANRISYSYNLQGPSLVVDTACSSTLSAFHIARLLLSAGECDRAIVAGVNLNLTPEETLGLTKSRLLSPEGRCRSFDAKARGFVKGDGAGAFVIRPLAAALAAGERVRAVIKGSAMNHNGKSNGVTAPNGPAQQRVIRAALANAGVAPSSVQFVEAHATGTELGDPIEYQALDAVLREGREPQQSCWVGSCKTNIGHLEAASGVASLLKAVFALERGEVPPNLHFDVPNPYLKYDRSCLRVPLRREPLRGAPSERIAGVSTFGFGGANTHLILSGHDVPELQAPAGVSSELEVLAISARSPDALDALMALHVERLGSVSDWASYCLAARLGRSHLRYRAAVVGLTADEAKHRLQALLAGTERFGAYRSVQRRRPRVGLSFGADAFDAWWSSADDNIVARAVRRLQSSAAAPHAIAGRAEHDAPLGTRWVLGTALPGSGPPEMGGLSDSGCDVVIQFFGGEAPAGAGERVTFALRSAGDQSRTDDELAAAAVAAAYVVGSPLAGEAWTPAARRTALPLYPFRGERYWIRPVHEDVPARQYGARRSPPHGPLSASPERSDASAAAITASDRYQADTETRSARIGEKDRATSQY